MLAKVGLPICVLHQYSKLSFWQSWLEHTKEIQGEEKRSKENKHS
jgi:hypothetical protein